MYQPDLWLSANHVSTRSAKIMGLGTVVEDCTTVTEMLDKANLSNLQVEKRPLVNREGFIHPNTYEMTYVNSDNMRVAFPDATVGNKYYPTQVEENLRIADGIMALGGKPESVVSIKNGVKYFASFKLDESIKVGGVDQVNMRLIFASSHDGSIANVFKVIGHQVECANQINLLLKGRVGAYTVRHTANAQANLVEARRTLDITSDWITELETVANELANVPMTVDQFEVLSHKVYPEPKVTDDIPNKRSVSKWKNHIESLRHIFTGVGELGNTNTTIRGTAWTGFSTFVEDIDWYRNSKENKNSFARTQQALGYIGNTAKNKTNILSIVQNFVDNEMPKQIPVS